MTITELLLANPGVELTLAYNSLLKLHTVKANNNCIEFTTSFYSRTKESDDESLAKAIKRAIGATK